MRVTADTKRRTRRRILDAADTLFRERGFDATTTREVATRSGVAAGTVFNYFSSKEALATALLAEAMETANADCSESRRDGDSLAEALFVGMVAMLRRLEAHRHLIAPVLETVLSPFCGATCDGAAADFRAPHLERVRQILESHGCTGGGDAVTLHLYWSLLLGVLSFWASRPAESADEVLAFIDRATRLFADAASRSGETSHVADPA